MSILPGVRVIDARSDPDARERRLEARLRRASEDGVLLLSRGSAAPGTRSDSRPIRIPWHLRRIGVDRQQWSRLLVPGEAVASSVSDLLEGRIRSREFGVLAVEQPDRIVRLVECGAFLRPVLDRRCPVLSDTWAYDADDPVDRQALLACICLDPYVMNR